jgi:hypothetical protein
VPSVYLTSTATSGDGIDGEALSLIDACQTALSQRPSRFSIARDLTVADFIVFIEPPRHKFAGYGDTLSAQPAVRRFPERCFAYDWADGPAGFLPGVYPSIGRNQWDPARLVAGGFLRPYNAAVLSAARVESYSSATPAFLMYFRGAASHVVRRRLTASLVDNPDVDVSLTEEWFTHSGEQKADHVSRLQSAKFAVCPRGVGAATFRVYEAMALGRAPVIVSDEWVEPQGPDWSKFALRVSEARISDLTRILREREDDWAEMGRLAHQAWEQFFAHPVAVATMLSAVERISLARARGETLDELRARWSSRRFKVENGWAKEQRLKRLITSTEVRRRLRRRIIPGASTALAGASFPRSRRQTRR